MEPDVDAHRPVPRAGPPRAADVRRVTADAIDLDIDRIAADYEAGVLTLRIPVADKAKPRRIEITGTDTDHREIRA